MTPVRLACCVAVFISLLLAAWRPTETSALFNGLEGRLLDVRFQMRGPRVASDSVVILAIDDAGLEAFGGFPFSRSALAETVTSIARADPTVVGFDLLLAGTSTGDQSLEEALEKLPRVVLATSLAKSGTRPDEALLNDMRRAAYPLVVGSIPPGPSGVLAPLARFSRSATLGHVNVPLDAGGDLRRVPVVMSFSDELYMPALPVTVAREVAKLKRRDVVLHASSLLEFGNRHVPLDNQSAAIVNFLGPAGSIPTYSLSNFRDVDLSGKAVFVGATAQGYGDRFSTPFAPGLPGVEVLATLTDNFLSGRVLRRDAVTWIIDISLATLAALFCALAASRRNLLVVSTTIGATWLVGLGGLQAAFHHDLWLDATTLLNGLFVGSLAGILARQRILALRSTNLARYKSPQIVEALARDAQPKFDGRMQQAAALFVDAAGFTSLSHQLGPQGTADFLKVFHAGIERAANSSCGTVEQFAGDGAMLIFGLPEQTSADAANALKCADLLFQEVADIPSQFRLEQNIDLHIRIGIHFGDVVAAVLGGADHGHVTITGSVVNAASRLQEVAKAEGVEMVASEDVLRAAGDKSFENFFALGPKELRGLDQPLKVWARHRS